MINKTRYLNNYIFILNDIFFFAECDGGMYGQDCGNTCGSCINNTQCHHINGTCLHVQGCGPGYKGDKCIEGMVHLW